MAKKRKGSQQKPAPAAPPARNGNRERIFKIILVFIPFLFFILLELTLRAIGYGKDIPLLQTFTSSPANYIINPELGARYFPATGVKPAVSQTDIFLKEKPDNVYRIFVLGGSSAAGYPYMFNGRFSSMLAVILEKHYPNQRFEMVNFAMPAVASYTLRDIALELGPHKPDLVLIYAGHNEFYGGLAVASAESLGRQRWLVNLFLSLRNYKTLNLVRDFMAWLRSGSGSQKDRGTLMERMVQEKDVPYDSELFHQATETFQGNMADIIDYFNAREIPVIVGSLVSNIRHQAPFTDVFSAETNQSNWQNSYQKALNSFKAGDIDGSLEAINLCIQQDSLPASQYYLLGEIREAAGDSAAAYQAFHLAKEYDGLRFRASEDLNEVIYQFRDEEKILLAPVKEAFEKYSPGRLIGKTLMLEHLHPTLTGYALMAKAYATTILNAELCGPSEVTVVPDQEWLSEIGVTYIDREVARIRIDYLMSGWPFQKNSPPPKREYTIPNATPLQKLALKFWMDEINWEQLHVETAALYSQQQDWENAAREYKALIRATPINSAPYLFLGQSLMRLNRVDEALSAFNQALSVEPGAYAYKMIGSIYLQQGNAAKAIPYLEQAVQADPADLQALFSLSQAYASAEKFSQAQVAVEQLLQRQSDYPRAKELLQSINSNF